jgi:hypothetical protein
MQKLKGDLIARKIVLVLLTILFISCSSTTNQIRSGDKHGAKDGSGNFILFNDKTYVVNSAGELIEVTDSFITGEAGRHLIGEGVKVTVSFSQFDPETTGLGTGAATLRADTGINGYIYNAETGSGIVITPLGYYNITQQDFDEIVAHLDSGDENADSLAEPNADHSPQSAKHEAVFGKAKNETVQKQKIPENCIENGIERFKDKDFIYCISRVRSGYAVTYRYGASSIIYTEKTDDLKSFKQNSELSVLVEFMQNKR